MPRVPDTPSQPSLGSIGAGPQNPAVALQGAFAKGAAALTDVSFQIVAAQNKAEFEKAQANLLTRANDLRSQFERDPDPSSATQRFTDEFDKEFGSVMESASNSAVRRELLSIKPRILEPRRVDLMQTSRARVITDLKNDVLLDALPKLESGIVNSSVGPVGEVEMREAALARDALLLGATDSMLPEEIETELFKSNRRTQIGRPQALMNMALQNNDMAMLAEAERTLNIPENVTLLDEGEELGLRGQIETVANKIEARLAEGQSDIEDDTFRLVVRSILESQSGGPPFTREDLLEHEPDMQVRDVLTSNALLKSFLPGAGIVRTNPDVFIRLRKSVSDFDPRAVDEVDAAYSHRQITTDDWETLRRDIDKNLGDDSPFVIAENALTRAFAAPEQWSYEQKTKTVKRGEAALRELRRFRDSDPPVEAYDAKLDQLLQAYGSPDTVGTAATGAGVASPDVFRRPWGLEARSPSSYTKQDIKDSAADLLKRRESGQLTREQVRAQLLILQQWDDWVTRKEAARRQPPQNRRSR